MRAAIVSAEDFIAGRALEALGMTHQPNGLAEFLHARIAEDGDVSPERWAAEREAKRRIVQGYQYLAADPDLREHAWTFALRCLAAPYADHQDYDPAWAVS